MISDQRPTSTTLTQDDIFNSKTIPKIHNQNSKKPTTTTLIQFKIIYLKMKSLTQKTRNFSTHISDQPCNIPTNKRMKR